MNRSRTSLLLLALSGSLLLAGCNQQAETSVVAPSASEVAAASATAAASAAAQNPSQTLATEDGVISLTVNGRFEDKLAEAAQYVDGADSNKPSLLQYDAASVPSVGRQKAPDSKVAGQANVFVFPDLNTGNTTYKAVQRSANVLSIGPMLQGLRKPVNDLSRGALVDDIVYTIALTAIQAVQMGK